MKAQIKKFILIFVGIVAGLVMLAGIAWLIYDASQFRNYQDNTLHFAVRYPVGWEVHKNPQKDVAVLFRAPQETALDVFRSNINITIQLVPDEIAGIKSFSQTISEQMKSVFQGNIRVLEDKAIMFGGRKGHRLVIEAPEPDHLKAVFVWVIRKDQAYIFTFMTTTRKYPRLSFQIEQILKSFKLM